jgi:hypothetical protein
MIMVLSSMLSCLVFIFFQRFNDLTDILGAFFDELHAAKIGLCNGIGIPPTLEIKVREFAHGLPQVVFRFVLRWSPGLPLSWARVLVCLDKCAFWCSHSTQTAEAVYQRLEGLARRHRAQVKVVREGVVDVIPDIYEPCSRRHVSSVASTF